MIEHIRKITKECLHKELVRHSMLNEIKELDEKWVKDYVNLNYPDSLNEMARINKKEFYGYFPFNKFDIRIWSNDHNPPHFHIISEGWDIVVGIENGEILKIKQFGKNTKIYSYIEDVINEWLLAENAFNKKLTNQENAMIIWDSLNDN